MRYEIIEILATQSFLDSYSQNQLGPKYIQRLDWSTLTRDEFKDYLEDFDEDQPDEYNPDLASKNYLLNLELEIRRLRGRASSFARRWGSSRDTNPLTLQL